MYDRIKAKLDEHVEKLLAKEELTSEEFSLLRFLYMEERSVLDRKHFADILKGLDL